MSVAGRMASEVWPDWLRESVPAKAVSAGGLVH